MMMPKYNIICKKVLRTCLNMFWDDLNKIFEKIFFGHTGFFGNFFERPKVIVVKQDIAIDQLPTDVSSCQM